VFPIRHFYQRRGATIAIERRPSVAEWRWECITDDYSTASRPTPCEQSSS
jgi:hypothetical protein